MTVGLRRLKLLSMSAVPGEIKAHAGLAMCYL